SPGRTRTRRAKSVVHEIHARPTMSPRQRGGLPGARLVLGAPPPGGGPAAGLWGSRLVLEGAGSLTHRLGVAGCDEVFVWMVRLVLRPPVRDSAPGRFALGGAALG